MNGKCLYCCSGMDNHTIFCPGKWRQDFDIKRQEELEGANAEANFDWGRRWIRWVGNFVDESKGEQMHLDNS